MLLCKTVISEEYRDSILFTGRVNLEADGPLAKHLMDLLQHCFV
jgi:hypothetical protein